MKVEVLSVQDCPTHAAAVKLVSEILCSERIAADVHEILVLDHNMATALRFRGSPTIRINGRDVDEKLAGADKASLSCRFYEGSERIGLPPAELVRQAIIRAREEGLV